MSADLIEYLVEYCVSRGRKSMRYIETVALAWTRDGVTTVEMARDASSRFSKDYYTILKAMGPYCSLHRPAKFPVCRQNTFRLEKEKRTYAGRCPASGCRTQETSA